MFYFSFFYVTKLISSLVLIMSTNNVNINGPINIVRLENKKMGKVVYLLFDYHNPLLQQLKCDDFTALSVSQLLERFFMKTNDYKTNKGMF